MNLSEAWEAAKAGLEAGPEAKPEAQPEAQPEAKPRSWLPWEPPAAPKDDGAPAPKPDAAPAPKPDAQPATPGGAGANSLEAALARLATLEGWQHDETERRTKRQAERDRLRSEFETGRTAKHEEHKRKHRGANLFGR